MKHETRLSAPPSLLSLYTRALFKRANPDTQPDVINTLVIDTRIDLNQLKKYNTLCQHTPKDNVIPPFFPQVLAFKLHLEILLNKQLPFPAMGLVHRSNHVEYLSAINPTDILTIKVGMSNYEQDKKGISCTLLTQVYVNNKLKWKASSTYFYRKKRSLPAKQNQTKLKHKVFPLDEHLSTWSLKANLGRQYAKITGDLNPIHLYAMTARLFGFKQSIIHGMCMAAKATAQAQTNPISFPFQVHIEFSKPVYLPSKIAFSNTDKGFSIYPIINQHVIDSPMLHGKFETNQGLPHSKAL